MTTHAAASAHAPLAPEDADAIYDALVQHAGACDDHHRQRFVDSQIDRFCPEYRFIGSLGSGGKFRRSTHSSDPAWYVTAYVEDINRLPDARARIDATNAALAHLHTHTRQSP